ncbi:hypothetical protein BH09SUM1_BH09SUM1_06730 [soil metagenome]
MSFELYFEDGLFRRSEPYLGGTNRPSGRASGTIYVYKYKAVEMGGAAMGYNHVGNGAFFHPTIPLPASAVPELRWFLKTPISPNVITVESTPYIADRGDVPSIALSQEFTGYVLNDYSGVMSVTYEQGNALFPGNEYYTYPKGGVGFSMNAYWGDRTAPSQPHEVTFSTTPAEGPMQVTLGMDGYTSTTVVLTAEKSFAFDYQNLLTPTTGKSASQYLQELGGEPSPPPLWVKRMALEEKLSGKVQWFYPPLDRYADVNGDGVYDAADLAALYAAAGKR